jgi:hypothetical protein
LQLEIEESNLQIKNVLYLQSLIEVLSDHSHEHEHEHEHEHLVGTHGFLMLGIKNLYLCHLPMYNMPPHSFQTILEAEIEGPAMEKYLKVKKENPARPIIVLNESSMVLEELANSSTFFGPIRFANVHGDPIGTPLGETTVKIKKILLFKPLNKNSPDYPEHLEYYLFGRNSDWHLSHSLSKAPNFEQELDISISGDLPDSEELHIIKISIPSVNERNSQQITKDPLTQNDYIIETENGDKFPISITNRFWINNSMLNMPSD